MASVKNIRTMIHIRGCIYIKKEKLKQELLSVGRSQMKDEDKKNGKER
jgi:hypothetical protein